MGVERAASGRFAGWAFVLRTALEIVRVHLHRLQLVPCYRPCVVLPSGSVTLAASHAQAERTRSDTPYASRCPVAPGVRTPACTPQLALQLTAGAAEAEGEMEQ